METMSLGGWLASSELGGCGGSPGLLGVGSAGRAEYKQISERLCPEMLEGLCRVPKVGGKAVLKKKIL